MVELELDGLHADGEHLVLRGSDGQRYLLTIDEALRLAVRRDRPQLEAYRANEASALRPRDIQSLIRAGASVEEVAAEGGLSLDSVRRFEGPVQAERLWIAEQTRALPIGREVGAPTLGDLVVDRLAARGVESSVTWDAVRRSGEPWEVVVTFDADGTQRTARWHVDLVARSLTATDEESRWLSETELNATSRRPGSPMRTRPYDLEREEPSRGAPDVVIRDGRDDPSRQTSTPPAGPPSVTAQAESERDEPAPAPADASADASTEALLDRLSAHRGQRAPSTRPAPSGDLGDEGSGSGNPVDDALFPVAPVLRFRPAPEISDVASAPEETQPTAATQPGEEAEATKPPARESRTTRAKGKRTSVPSWDEIVFGAKQD